MLRHFGKSAIATNYWPILVAASLVKSWVGNNLLKRVMTVALEMSKIFSKSGKRYGS